MNLISAPTADVAIPGLAAGSSNNCTRTVSKDRVTGRDAAADLRAEEPPGNAPWGFFAYPVGTMLML